MNPLRKTIAVSFFALLTIGVLSTTPSAANTIPAWLDDSITKYNANNPTNPIKFVGVRDAYVWYSLVPTPEVGSKEIRDRVYALAYENGYKNTQLEESVTTGKPLTASGQVTPSKCWTRSFLLEASGEGSSPGTSRMLTTLVCQGDANWSAGFRIVQ